MVIPSRKVFCMSGWAEMVRRIPSLRWDAANSHEHPQSLLAILALLMPTYKTTSPPAPSLHRIADVVYHSLETALTEQCSRDHDTDVVLGRRERTAADQPMVVKIECPNQGRLTAQIGIRHVGGNVYDVRCEVENGASRRFTYSQPRRSGTTLSRAPSLGQKLGRFLLDELQHHLGRRLLHANEQSATD